MASYRSMIPVRLTPVEADTADAVAERQARGARRDGRRDAWGVALDRSLHGHRVGNRGELAFSKWSGIPWKPSYVPQGTAPDVGKYEVKTASLLAPSYDDALRIPTYRFRRDRIYVAVRAWSRYDHDVVGWITGAIAQDYYPPADARFPGQRQAHRIPYGDLGELDVMP